MWNIPFVGGHCLCTIKYASVLDVLLIDKVFRLLHLWFCFWWFIIWCSASMIVHMLCLWRDELPKPIEESLRTLTHTHTQRERHTHTQTNCRQRNEKPKKKSTPRKEDERTVFGVQLFSLGAMIICWKCLDVASLWINAEFLAARDVQCDVQCDVGRDVAISSEQFNTARNQLPNIQLVLRCSYLRNRFQSVELLSEYA